MVAKNLQILKIAFMVSILQRMLWGRSKAEERMVTMDPFNGVSHNVAVYTNVSAALNENLLYLHVSYGYET